MKRVVGRNGLERLWFEEGEVERCMADELRLAGLYPTIDSPVVDLEGLVEQHLQVDLDQYAALANEVLGLTQFNPRGRHRILINKDLTGTALDSDDPNPGLVGRWRATVGHEAAHVILHACLFPADQGQLDLFAGAPEPKGTPESGPFQQCLKRDLAFGGRNADWREVQANMGMAALLMPMDTFAVVVARELELPPFRGQSPLKDSPETPLLASRLATIFQVSRQAARIRLETVGAFATPGQASLF